ncbi:hypothetical protein DTO012A8_7508 [Penicillium roqueforti]|nr:hypothetical protein DTO012A8_7508 [Penicillium roqueforti]
MLAATRAPTLITDDNKDNRRQQRQPTTTKTTDDNKDKMTPKSNEPTSARGPEDMERKGRTRRETVMAHEATVIEDNGSDDDDYQPSNEGDRTVMPENAGATPMIDAFDYVSPNHPLRPARAICVLDRAQQLARLRHHFEIWWDVMLAMDKQAKMNTNQVTDDVIREEVIRLGEDNRELRRERDRMTVQRDLAEKRVEELTLKLDGACRERDQSILTVMNTARQSMPVPGRNNNSRVPRRESSHLPHNSPERFNNPKFPDAPVFSGDRGAFDSWRDKVQDKLMNSAAQYPNEEQRIAYIRSRTDGQLG